MRGSHFALASACALAGTSTALTLQKKDSPSVFQLDIQRRVDAGDIGAAARRDQNRRQRRKRDNVVTETLDNEQLLYYANVTLGTPAQNLRVHIDTGSSDLWVNTDASTFCSSSKNKDVCADNGGTYDANSSSTYEYINSEFNISYADGTGAAGDYVSDKLSIGGEDVTLQFGIGYTSTSEEGVLGIGYATNEIQVNYNDEKPYNNLPLAMVSQGLIKAAAYSLWLNDLESSTGTILFGGVNTGKYHGTLMAVPIVQEDKEFVEFVIGMDGVNYTAGDVANTTDQAWSLSSSALLDSGTSLIYLPDELTSEIYTAVGASYYDSYGLAYAPCAYSGQGGSLDFSFGPAKISVGMAELFLNASSSQGEPATFTDGTAACIFGVLPAGEDTPVLGDTFLRSAYVVYDLDNNEIGLANTNFFSAEDHVYEITNGTSGIPNATGIASPKTTKPASASAAVPRAVASGAVAFAAAFGALSLMSALAFLF